MEVYNEFINSSTSLCSIHCNFTSADDNNLIVSKGNVLQIFNIIEIEPNENASGESLDQVISNSESFISDDMLSGFYDRYYKLSLISEYTLNGKICNIQKFKSNENENIDYLIISTEIAKLSIIKWDESTHSVNDISLHYYETALETLIMGKLLDSEILHRTDPNGLCTALHANDIFTFLPFFKDELADDNMDDESQLEEKKEFVKKHQGQDQETKKEKETDNSSRKDSKKIFNQSFIVNAKVLYPDLKNIIDFNFLYSYRNPTVAILYAPETISWAGYLPKAKDNMKVVVLSLDLDKKKASVIMEIPNLPYDVEHIYSLPQPINGFLVLGANEVIHINSLGSTKGIYVNEFFPKISTMNLKNQSQLDLKLENCQVCHVGDNEVLLITQTGLFFTLLFDEVGGISNLRQITTVERENYQNVKLCSVLDIENIPDLNLVFISCQGSDSILLQWRNQTKKKTLESKSITSINSISNEDDDSWLYNDEKDETVAKLDTDKSLANSKFIEMDRLINLGPCSDFTLGHISTDMKLIGLPNPNFKENAIIATSGLDQCGSLSILNPTVKPLIKSTLKFSNASKIWTINDDKGITQYLITTDFKTYKTQIFQVNKNYKDLFTKGFNNEEFTIQFGLMETSYGIKPVQVTPYKVTVYNFRFRPTTSLSYEQEINYATIYDKFVIVIMKNGELDILEYNEADKKLEKMDLPALLNYLIFTNGWISETSILNHIKVTKSVKRKNDGEFVRVEENSTEETAFWLVTADNRLLVFKKDHKERVYEFKNIHKVPEFLQLSPMNPNYEADVDPIIKQIMFTKIGDKYATKDYLIILTFGGEIIIYETFFDPISGIYRLVKANDIFQFPVVGAPENSYSYATKIERNLFKLDNLEGSNSVLITGAMSFIIYRQCNSTPRLFQFTSKPLLYFAPFNNDKCKNGFISIDDKKSCRMCQLDSHFDYSNRLPIMKKEIGETINKVEYHELSNTFILSTLTHSRYAPIDEDGNELQGFNKDTHLPAQNYKGHIKLISPVNWSVIDIVGLEDNEVCNSLEVLNLGVIETKRQKNLIFVGTGNYRNEDLSTNGAWKLFEMIDIVPEIGKPEAKNRLKMLTSEAAKGPVLDACGINGRFAVVQGQRMLVRTLKSEGNAAPVAFTDTSLYTRKVKTFENMMIIGDAYQSISLYGFDAEPYRMISLGRDENLMKLNECEFITHEGNLFILASDENCILHLLQYDPYDVDSLKGSKLLRKSAFRSSGYTTVMKCVDRRRSLFSMVSTLGIKKDVDLGFEVLACNIDGSFYKVSPVNEFQYRRFYSLQNYINDKEQHWLGLNPKMNAIGKLSDCVPVIKRPFIETRLIMKFLNLNEDKKRLFAKKIGKNALVEIYKDLISLQ